MPEQLRFEPDPEIRCRDFKIGCIGAGFIMADVQLSAYAMAHFPVVAIASRQAEKAAEVATRWKIPTVHQTPQELIEDPNVEIVDIAFPPDQQPELIRHALKQKHVRGILAQKPLAMDFSQAKAIVEEAAATALDVTARDGAGPGRRHLREDRWLRHRLLKSSFWRGLSIHSSPGFLCALLSRQLPRRTRHPSRPPSCPVSLTE